MTARQGTRPPTISQSSRHCKQRKEVVKRRFRIGQRERQEQAGALQGEKEAAWFEALRPARQPLRGVPAVAECVTLDGPQEPREGVAYVIGVDLG